MAKNSKSKQLKKSNKAFAKEIARLTRSSYDGADISGKRRRQPPTTTSHEDEVLNERKRTILSANARDLARNLELLDWALRCHLAYITDLTFTAKTDDREFNAYLEEWFEEQGKPWNHDVAGRHGFKRMVRLAEACRVLDGDIGWLLYNTGPNRGKVQAIEGDRIITPDPIPKNQKPEEWVNGVRIDLRTGRTLAYGIGRRIKGSSRKELEQTVPSSRMLLHAFYGFRCDQVRGISPIASALNTLRDYHETTEYAKAKVKLSQVIGLAVMSEPENGEVFVPGTFGRGADESQTDDGGTEGATECSDTSMGECLQGGAPFITNLNPGESVEVVESKTPSTETVAFLKLMIQQVLAALDIPYSMWSEEFSNYAGQRAALMRYLYCAMPKIIELQWFLTQFSRWKMGLAVEDGTLVLPPGKEFSFIKFEFVPGGVPFDQPQREAQGVAKMIQMGLSNPYDAAKEIGKNFETNVDLRAQAEEYAKSKSVTLDYGEIVVTPEEEIQQVVEDVIVDEKDK